MSLNVSVSSSEYFTFGTEDYVVFVLMLVLSSAIGIYFGFFGKGADTADEYLMGGKRMKTLPIAISLVASLALNQGGLRNFTTYMVQKWTTPDQSKGQYNTTSAPENIEQDVKFVNKFISSTDNCQLSGISIMALPAEIYSFGISHVFGVIAIFGCVPILCLIVIPVFHNNNIANCYEYLELRFNRKIRRLVTALFVITVYMMMPVFIFIPALAFSQVTGVNIHLINGIVCFICVFYTMLGGIKAVVWTDVIQGLIMLSSVLLVGIMGTYKVGGFGKVVDFALEGGRLQPNMEFDLKTRVTLWNTFFGGIIMWTGYVGFNQSCVQRIVSLPSLAHARKALFIFGIGFLLISGMNCFIGVVLFARYHDCDPVTAGVVEKPDKLMPFFVQDIVGHLKGMPGVFISAVFSAALSTMSANLNSLSGIFYYDYVRPFLKNHNERKANLIMRAFVFVTGFYCLLGGLVVGKFKSIVQMIVTISGITHGAIFGIFTLGMLVPKAHGRAGFYGVLFSIATLVWIILGAQLRFQSGVLKYHPLPTDTDGCDAFNITLPISIFQSTTKAPPINDDGFSLYNVSFHWYKVIGAFCVWILALPLSYLIPPDDDKKLNPKLLTPFVQRLLHDEYILPEEVPLKEKPHVKKDSIDAPC